MTRGWLLGISFHFPSVRTRPQSEAPNIETDKWWALNHPRFLAIGCLVASSAEQVVCGGAEAHFFCASALATDCMTLCLHALRKPETAQSKQAITDSIFNID